MIKRGIHFLIFALVATFSAGTKAGTISCEGLFLGSRVSAPEAFVRGQVKMVLQPFQPTPVAVAELSIPAAKRNPFLALVYAQNWVRADKVGQLLSDKLIFQEAAIRGRPEVAKYLPKTLGLKDFLFSKGLLDSNFKIAADTKKIKNVLLTEFPEGFVVKPTTGFASEGKGAKFYFSEDAFIADLVKRDSHLYNEKEFLKPFFSDVLGVTASGESLVLQAKAIPVTSNPLNYQNRVEFRLHTYETKVIKGATSGRWLQPLVPEVVETIEAQVEQFLQALPAEMVKRSAWGVDVIFDGARVHIVDVNTNRGKQIQWSGYMTSPFVLQGYAQHFQNLGYVKWTGAAMAEILAGRSDFQQWVEKLPDEVEAHYRNSKIEIPAKLAQDIQKSKEENAKLSQK